ncbi:hypothetical protein GCM10020295_73110 [Streptomyces cinereospinus]
MSGEPASADPLEPDGGRDEAVAATSGTSPRPPVPGLPAGEVFTALGTSRRGLPLAQARARLERYGSNELPRVGRPAVWRHAGGAVQEIHTAFQ